jgi:multicomponent Na+:H+ antiporter subunit G
MSLALDIYSAVAISAGTFFFLAGTAALLRFPDSLTRLHALTKADNLGLGFVVLGLLPRAESLLGGAKLVILWGLVQLSSAVVAQMIGSALRRRGRSSEALRSRACRSPAARWPRGRSRIFSAMASRACSRICHPLRARS